MKTDTPRNPHRPEFSASMEPSIVRGASGMVRKGVVLVFGSILLLIGVAMIILPGPALVVIPAALALLATEFPWAKRLLAKLLSLARGAWVRAKVGWRAFRQTRLKARREVPSPGGPNPPPLSHLAIGCEDLTKHREESEEA